MLLDNSLLLSMSDLLPKSCLLCQQGLVIKPRFSHFLLDDMYQPERFTPFHLLVIKE
jgi:hypothetical protein